MLLKRPRPGVSPHLLVRFWPFQSEREQRLLKRNLLMEGLNDSVSFFLSACVPALLELGCWRVENIEHHVADFAV